MTTPTTSFDRFIAQGQIALCDGGLETSMIFHEGFDLPEFSSMTLLESDEGRAALSRYFDEYLELAARKRVGFVLDTASWRSGIYWADALNRTEDEMLAGCRAAVHFAKAIRQRWASRVDPIVLNGVVGPAGDGYAVEQAYGASVAEAVHLPQISAMAEAGAEMISAVTMTHVGEAVGIARAAVQVGLPVVISFTVETDGRLPSGETLEEAITATDRATAGAPAYYMVNCAHPDHFRDACASEAHWLERIGGIRANASRMSHAELDAAEELDEGDPTEFGHLHAELAKLFPNLRVVGGCCGTDHRHIGCVSQHLHVSEAA